MIDVAAEDRSHEIIKINNEDTAFTHQTVGTLIAGWLGVKQTFHVIEKECAADHLQ